MSGQRNLGVDLVGFDLDGTLYGMTPKIKQIQREKIYEKLSGELGIPVDRIKDLWLKNYEGDFDWSKSGSKTIEHISGLPESRAKVTKDRGGDIVQEALEEAVFLHLIPSNPDLVDMINRLKSRYEVDLVTGSPHGMAMKKLDRIGIDPNTFGMILCGTDENGERVGSKVTGDLYKFWMERRGVSPERILYVGDNPKQDIKPCRDLGIKTCYVGGESNESDCWIDKVIDLEKIL